MFCSTATYSKNLCPMHDFPPGRLFQIRDMFTRHDITTSKNKYFLFLYCPSSSEWSDVSKNVIKNGFTQQQHVQNLCVPCMIFFFPGAPGKISGGPPDISKIFPRKSRGLLQRPPKRPRGITIDWKCSNVHPMYPQYARNNFCQPYPALEDTRTSSTSRKTRKSRCFTVT